MRTMKRDIPSIDTSLTSYSKSLKYFNQMNFKGILEDENIYAIDQESFRDANNVYVNDDERLVSRPTLQEDKNVPEGVIPEGYTLREIQRIGKGTLYISEQKITNNDFAENMGLNKIVISYYTYVNEPIIKTLTIDPTFNSGLLTFNKFVYSEDYTLQPTISISINLITKDIIVDCNIKDYTYTTIWSDEYNCKLLFDFKDKLTYDIFGKANIEVDIKFNKRTENEKANIVVTTKPIITIPNEENLNVTIPLNTASTYNEVGSQKFIYNIPNANKTKLLTVTGIFGAGERYKGSFSINPQTETIANISNIPENYLKILKYNKTNETLTISLPSENPEDPLTDIAGPFTIIGAISMTEEDYSDFPTVIDYENNSYHIAVLEHYIIVFSKIGAKVLDIKNVNIGWKDISEYSEIPITKRVIGPNTTTYPGNNLTNSYKEQYVWSNNSHPEIPTNLNKGEVELLSLEGSYTYNIEEASKFTNYKILRKINVAKEPNVITIEKGIICYGYNDRFDISLNNGESFTTVYYPADKLYGTNIGTIFPAVLTKDAVSVAVIGLNGVYICDLGTLTWTDFYSLKDKGSIKQGNCKLDSIYFITKDIFSFVINFKNEDKNVNRLYFKGPGLHTGTNYSVGINDFEYLDSLPTYTASRKTTLDLGAAIDFPTISIFMSMITDIDQNNVAAIIITSNIVNWCYCFSIIGGNNPHAETGVNDMLTDLNQISIYKIIPYELKKLDSSMASNVTPKMDFEITGIALGSDIQNTEYFEYRANVFIDKTTDNKIIHTYVGFRINIPTLQYDMLFPPIPIENGYITLTSNSFGSNIFICFSATPEAPKEWFELPDLRPGAKPSQLYIVGDIFYAYYDKIGFVTNLLRDTDTATITFTHISSSKFTDIPNISYNGTELFLGFDNLLRITQNSKNGEDILFNLPSLNDQSFTDNITGIINISTVDIAIFFENKIVICQKVEDSNLSTGYRYDYYNTKLSTGIRLGDSVINSLEGSYTIFPTRRGLALMNYQAFMATTDQILNYVTDTIKDLWTNFFDNSTIIKIIQHRTKLLLTNNTNTILLYDLVTGAWWKWTVPVITSLIYSNQIDINLVSGRLCIFKNSKKYFDFSETQESQRISWYFQSQPLHMKTPNYYKNLKQLIFQLYDGEKDYKQQSILVQIKLYRKKISYKEPEIIAFKIDNLRTFVKRFNYWKINEIQYGLASDDETIIPEQFQLNAITIKYELGEEVR